LFEKNIELQIRLNSKLLKNELTFILIHDICTFSFKRRDVALYCIVLQQTKVVLLLFRQFFRISDGTTLLLRGIKCRTTKYRNSNCGLQNVGITNFPNLILRGYYLAPGGGHLSPAWGCQEGQTDSIFSIFFRQFDFR
jgi:hypothetical protein